MVSAVVRAVYLVYCHAEEEGRETESCKTAAARLVGWLPLRDLDIKAEGTVLRMLGEAQRQGGAPRMDGAAAAPELEGK